MDNSKIEHPQLAHDWIDPEAIQIIKILQSASFETYLVGGCVRDLLAGINPKDYDIATTAQPEQVKKLVKFSFIIGRRFRLVLVKRGERQYEVATFRRDPEPQELGNEDISPDNLFGTAKEDAQRRDFTINALFFDPINNQIVDYCGGLTDIDNRVIRMIGPNEIRLQEDPIRILRAIRLAHKLNFSIDSILRDAIHKNASSVQRSVLPRRREEVLKILRLPNPAQCLHELYDLDVLRYLLPTLNQIYKDPISLTEFEFYLQKINETSSGLETPSDLFGGLLFAYSRALEINSGGRGFKEEDAKHFLRDELGMSNFEQRVFTRALSMQSLLQNVSKIRLKGERRQFAILASDSFPLALKMARTDHLIGGADYLFWRNAYQKALPKIQELQDQERHQRRRRPRNRRQSVHLRKN